MKNEEFASWFCKRKAHILRSFHWDPSHTHSLMMHRNFDFVFTTDKLRVSEVGVEVRWIRKYKPSVFHDNRHAAWK